MKLNELDLTTFGKKNKELDVPKYTDGYDYGDKSNNIATNDVVVKSSKDGTVYGRRQVKQRKLKKSKTNPHKNWDGLKKL